MFGQNKHGYELENSKCLKCQYEELFKTDKILFDKGDKQQPVPVELVAIKNN